MLTRTIANSATTITTYPFGVEEHQYNGRGVPTSVDKYYYSLAGKLIGMLNGSLMEFALTDDLGSIRTAIINKAGAAIVKGYMGYGPFGFQQYSAAKTGTNKGYTGQYNDPLSGLDYYVARYYDPVVGLFLSADTVQGNLLGFNPYAYVGENPETLTDPTGHWGWGDTLLTALAVVTVTALVVGVVVAAPLIVGAGAAIITGDVVSIGVADVLAAGTASLWSTAAATAGGALAGVGTTAAADAFVFHRHITPNEIWGSAYLGGISSGLISTWGVSLVAATIGSSAVKDVATGLGSSLAAGLVGGSCSIACTPGPSHQQNGNTHKSSGGNPASKNSALPSINYSPPTKTTGYSAPTRTQSSPPGTSNPASHPTSGPSWMSYTVSSGDTLWGIAASFYGSGLEWQRIYQANMGVIGGNPNLIYAGERLRILR